jgi:hypothetical protein
LSKLRKATLTSNYVKVEVHGETGDGKTRFGMSFPGPRVWIDPAHGCRYFASLADYITNTRDIDSFVEAIEDAISMAHRGEVKTIILDDVSVMQRQLTGVLANDPDEVNISEWGTIKGIVDRTMDKVLAAPVHLLITSRAAMVAVESTATGKVANVHKAARPKAWDNWIYPVDYNLFLFTKGSELAPDKLRYFAQIQKSRSGHLYPTLKQGVIIENPDFPSVFREPLEAEKGLPPTEYEDAEAVLTAGRAARTKASSPDSAALFEKAAGVIRMSDTQETLSGAWTNAANLIREGKFTVDQQSELLKVKNEAKTRLGMA